MIAAFCLYVAVLLSLPCLAQPTISISQKKGRDDRSDGYRDHRHKAAVVPVVEDQSFWFANVTVGAAVRSLLIDTGSNGLALNLGAYAPSPKSKNLHQNASADYGTTNPNGTGTAILTGALYRDLVAIEGLVVPHQEFLVVAEPATPYNFPHNGAIAFAAYGNRTTARETWIDSVCQDGRVQQCRFGLAFDTDGTGSMVLGTIDPTYADILTIAPVGPTGGWAVEGDIAVQGTVLEPSRRIVTDSGTSVIFGPIADVQAIYEDLKIPYSIVPGNTTTQTPTYLYGYIPCDKPPTVGFGFPSADAAKAAASNSSSPVSKTSTIFNIEPGVWNVKDNGNNNCTAVLQGSDKYPFWLVGQPFFQGHYIDHNIDQQTMGFAKLHKQGEAYKSRRRQV